MEYWKLSDGRSLSQVERVSREEGGELLTAAKRQAILDRHQKLVDEEAVPPQSELDSNYQAFRERFGPFIRGKRIMPLFEKMVGFVTMANFTNRPRPQVAPC